MKRCPYCSQDVQEAAQVCRFCERPLGDTAQHVRPHASPSPQPVARRRTFSVWVLAMTFVSGTALGAIIATVGAPRSAVGAAARKSAIDSADFSDLHRAAKELQASTSVGVNYQQFGELVRRFVLELELAAPRANEEKERALISSFGAAASNYRDSLTAWGG
jgi:hypothetical protein